MPHRGEERDKRWVWGKHNLTERRKNGHQRERQYGQNPKASTIEELLSISAILKSWIHELYKNKFTFLKVIQRKE